MSTGKKKRAVMPDAETYMTFHPERGYVWGPACGEKRVPGSKPYWNTGLPATWRYLTEEGAK